MGTDSAIHGGPEEWFRVLASIRKAHEPPEGINPVLDTLPEPRCDDTEVRLFSELSRNFPEAFRRYHGLWQRYPWPLLAVVDNLEAPTEHRIQAWCHLVECRVIRVGIHRMDYLRALPELIIRAQDERVSVMNSYRQVINDAATFTICRYPRLNGYHLHREIRLEMKRVLKVNKRTKRRSVSAWTFSQLSPQMMTIVEASYNPYGIEEEMRRREEEREFVEMERHRQRLEASVIASIRRTITPDEYAALRKRTTELRARSPLTAAERKRAQRAREKLNKAWRRSLPPKVAAAALLSEDVTKLLRGTPLLI